MKEVISVIVPIYNAETYLKRCIESLLNQTYSNMEIILIDDGSTDNSLKICEEYSAKDIRIKVFSKKNSGPSDTRNYGLKKASGKYISFIDSDDWVEPKFYEYLYNLINEYDNTDIACVQYTTSDDNIIEKRENKRLLEEKEILIDYFCNNNIMTCLWNKLYRIETIKDIFFDTEVGNYGEDVLFLCKVFCKTKKLIYSNMEMYHYNVQNSSITRSYLDIKKVKSCIKAHEIQIDCIRTRFNSDKFLDEKTLEKLAEVLLFFYGQIEKDTSKDVIKTIREKIKEIIKKYKNVNKKSKYLYKLEIILYFGKLYFKIINVKNKLITKKQY